MNLTDKNIAAINTLCEKYRVKALYLFGSVVTDKFNKSSDIDVLIQFGDIALEEYFDNYLDFKEEMEKLLGRPVDIVENQAIRNPIFRRVVDRDKLLIYERKSA
ncbi:MAG TPA: nucleotidyltransferase domain-containing protein [Bacteroidales bacterium]|nr:nucleotidyltransferase domain-containing protein [Bacteroidales bacterium]